MAKRESAKPKRGAGNEDADASARKIQDDRGNHQRERGTPKDPAVSSLAKIVLAAGENHDRGQAKKISGLVAIRERPEIAFVMPEGWSGVPKPEQNADRRKNDDAGGEQTELEPRFA